MPTTSGSTGSEVNTPKNLRTSASGKTRRFTSSSRNTFLRSRQTKFYQPFQALQLSGPKIMLGYDKRSRFTQKRETWHPSLFKAIRMALTTTWLCRSETWTAKSLPAMAVHWPSLKLSIQPEALLIAPRLPGPLSAAPRRPALNKLLLDWNKWGFKNNKLSSWHGSTTRGTWQTRYTQSSI
jgi:hypothetical protein